MIVMVMMVMVMIVMVVMVRRMAINAEDGDYEA